MTIVYADPQGTATVAVDWATLKGSRRYLDPYGNSLDIKVGTNPWLAPTGHGYLDKPITGHGLVDMGVREYDPVLGQFTSLDPILVPNDPRSHNQYGYTSGDPVNTADPSGLFVPSTIGCLDVCEGKDAWRIVVTGGSGGSPVKVVLDTPLTRVLKRPVKVGDPALNGYRNNSPIADTPSLPAPFFPGVPQSLVGSWVCLNYGKTGCFDIKGQSDEILSLSGDYLGEMRVDQSGVANRANAYRHFAWMVQLAAEYGPYFAKDLGDAHEQGMSGTNQQADSERDQKNNDFARDWLAQNRSVYASLSTDQDTRTEQLMIIASKLYDADYFARLSG